MLSLTATELPRFMVCNGSRLMGKVAAFEPDTTVTDEGNAAHWLIEQVFRGHFSAEELIDRKAPNGVYISHEMVEHTTEYWSDLRVAKAAGFFADVEVDTSYSNSGWEIRGRADGIIVFDKELIVPDFKYGWKIVEPQNNWTLISHAIGFLSRNSHTLQTVKTIRFKIYQPRAYHPDGHVREWLISVEELLNYWEQLQTALSNPSDECVTSEQCYKCPSFAKCKSGIIATMNAIDVAYKKHESEPDNESLQYILDETKRAAEILNQSIDAYEELALHRLKMGQRIPNYSIQSGKGQARWKEGITAELVQMLTGVDVTKKTIVTPAQAKKAGLSEEIVTSLTDRPNTGFKLVRMDESKKAEKLLGKKGN